MGKTAKGMAWLSSLVDGSHGKVLVPIWIVVSWVLCSLRFERFKERDDLAQGGLPVLLLRPSR